MRSSLKWILLAVAIPFLVSVFITSDFFDSERDSFRFGLCLLGVSGLAILLSVINLLIRAVRMESEKISNSPRKTFFMFLLILGSILAFLASIPIAFMGSVILMAWGSELNMLLFS